MDPKTTTPKAEDLFDMLDPQDTEKETLFQLKFANAQHEQAAEGQKKYSAELRKEIRSLETELKLARAEMKALMAENAALTKQNIKLENDLKQASASLYRATYY